MISNGGDYRVFIVFVNNLVKKSTAVHEIVF